MFTHEEEQQVLCRNHDKNGTFSEVTELAVPPNNWLSLSGHIVHL